ncbi:MAG: hypothetical protein JXB62_05930 [Pirellulales bacterium]|nr:hypothetical protein [Pirellulales bacterium]
MYGNEHEFLERIAGPMGWFYLSACAVNLLAAGRALRGRRPQRAGAWGAVGLTFAVLGWRAFDGNPAAMPEACKDAIDAVLGPVTFTLGSFLILWGLYLGRRVFVRPAVAFAGLNVSLLFLGLSLTDAQFAAVVIQPDNVPIVAMVYLLALFTWLSASAAVKNDRRLGQGLAPAEKDQAEKALVWPDLVYTELICMILASAVLLIWSLSVQAPLEQPANPAVTPNPSKAPWYFVGLQELLVFSDAWIVGVVVPCLIAFGLMAIPYLDPNPQGSGYYTIRQRPFAYGVFQFGFLLLWVLLILVGTFMRGPNWGFFGLYEVRDPHKVLALGNVKLSEYFWTIWLGRGVPQVAADAGSLAQFGHILWREIAGVTLVGLYFVALPPLLGRTLLRRLRAQMGFGRFTLMAVLLLAMMTLPLKMILRWTMNLSYVVSMPECFFNL